MIEFVKYNFYTDSLFQGRITLEQIRNRLIEKGELHFYGYYEIAKDESGNDVYLKIPGPESDTYNVYDSPSLENYLSHRFRDNFKYGKFERTVTFLNPESKDRMDKMSRRYDLDLFRFGKLQKTYSNECIEIYER